jgi:hypothetical protein
MHIATLNLTMLSKIYNGIEYFVQMFPETPSPKSIKFELDHLTEDEIRELLLNKELESNNIIYQLKPFRDEA